MSENIEGAAAKRAASGAGRSPGAVAGLVGYMLGRGGRGSSGRGSSGSRPLTAADYHNEEIAKRYDFERNIQQTKLDESVRNADFTRTQGAKNAKFIRKTAKAENASKIKKSELRTAAGTAKRTGISSLAMQADGGFNLSMFDRPDTPASPSKTIRPPRSTVAKGKQFSAPAEGMKRPANGAEADAIMRAQPGNIDMTKVKKPTGFGGRTAEQAANW